LLQNKYSAVDSTIILNPAMGSVATQEWENDLLSVAGFVRLLLGGLTGPAGAARVCLVSGGLSHLGNLITFLSELFPFLFLFFSWINFLSFLSPVPPYYRSLFLIFPLQMSVADIPSPFSLPLPRGGFLRNIDPCCTGCYVLAQGWTMLRLSCLKFWCPWCGLTYVNIT
jgi:hypothetical protein